MKQARNLVLFDFDGTLYKGDSLLRFLWFAVPVHHFLLHSIVLIFNYLWLILSRKFSSQQAKAALLRQFFGGWEENRLCRLGQQFAQLHIPTALRPDLVAIMRKHLDDGDAVAIVSASLDIWLAPFCENEGVELLCTELRFTAARFRGELATPNCKGEEKARRILSKYSPKNFQKVIAYGNSSGDNQMFELADEAWLLSRKGPVLIGRV